MDVGSGVNRAVSARTNVYFARYEGEDLAHELIAKVEQYERYLRNSGLYGVLRKSYRMFFGMTEEGYSSKEMGRKGEDGEYAVVVMNHYRNLGTHLANLMMQAIPGLEPEPVNSDFESERQAKFAKNLLTAYLKDGASDAVPLEDSEREAFMQAVWAGAVWLVPTWDPNAGEAVIPDGMMDAAPTPAAPGTVEPALPPNAEGSPVPVVNENPPPPNDTRSPQTSELPPVPQMLHEGDFKFRLYNPFDCIQNPLWKKPDGNPWRIYRRWEDRHEIAAQYADKLDEEGQPLGEKILSVGLRSRALDYNFTLFELPSGEQGDLIEVFEFYHERTAALPAGKRGIFLAGGIMLEEGPLGEYDHIPGRRFAFADTTGTPWGYSPLFDAMAPQEAHNMLMSMIISNVRAFGYGTIAAPMGSNLQPDRIASGLDLYEYPLGMPKPEALDLCKIPQEVLVAEEKTVGGMETITGVNAVTRGVPQPSLKSGSALTFADSRSAEYAQGAQKRAISFVAGLATDLINGLCKFAANRPRTRVLAGDYESSLMGPVTFQGEDLSRVRRVRAVPVDLMSQSFSGRMELVQMLMNHPDPRYHPTPAQVFSFMATGRWETISKRDERQLANIRAFQSLLAKGQLPGNPPDFGVLVTDNHQLWIQELLTVVDSPAVRADPTGRVKDVTLAVVQRHLDMWAELSLTNPAILEMTGQAPLTTALQYMQSALGLAVPELGQQPGSTPGAASVGPQQQPARGAVQPAPQKANQDRPAQPNGEPRMPRMPVNPGTGRRAPDPRQQQPAA